MNSFYGPPPAWLPITVQSGEKDPRAEFISKIGIVIEEADETVFWLEMLADRGIVKPEKLSEILEEANQLLNIFSASGKTARS